MSDDENDDVCPDCGGELDELDEHEQEIWSDGFANGMDAHFEEMYEAANVLGGNYIKMLDELFEIIEAKYSSEEDKN